MGVEKKMLSILLEYLDDIDNKLKETTGGQVWKHCTSTKERYRSFTHIKTILNSLVKKTIRDVNCQNEGATVNRNEEVQDIPPNSQSLLSSDEYLARTKHLLIIPSTAEILHKYLLTLQDLLEDLLYSICQINNYYMNLPSGMSVQDIEKLQKHYISISESLGFSSNNCDTHETQHLSKANNTEKENESRKKVEILHKSLQLCLKEMSKVKLEIEHYFKNNIIEMQFNLNNVGNGLLVQGAIEKATSGNVNINSDSCLSDKPVLPNNNDDNLYMSDENNEKYILYVPMEKTAFSKAGSKCVNMVPQHFKEDKRNISNVFCSSSHTPWIKDNNNSCAGLFTNPLLYSDLLFVETESVLLGANKKTFPCRSLPKIYSLESIAEEADNEDTFEKKEDKPNHEDKVDTNKSQSYDLHQIYHIGNKENACNITLEEDEFSDESLTMDIKAKISSLFSLLRNNQLSDEDLFKEDSRKPENNFLFDSQHKSQLRELPTDNNKNNMTFNKISKINKMNKEPMQINQNNINRKTKMCHGRKSNVNGNNFDPSIRNEVEEQCDETSLIELFKTTDILTPNTGSSQIEEENLSSWPVTAKYINVSGSKRGSDNGSELGDNSISLAKSFEKSLYAIHLNKRYEQKQIYDGNLIVLDNSKTLVKEDSDYSLMNQSFVVFDVNHCEVNANKCRNNHGGNNNSHFPALKNNPPLPYPISILPNINKNMDLGKTMTVQYAQCDGVPYIAKQENFQRRNFDMFNIDGYNDVNWNSFISIYTSKIGRSARIKQHTMFGKIVNNVGGDYQRNGNMFTNVHTLTSNGGPFRLFDINGYPLTDSVGNVLKDPYGKSVVQLDSTGFPKTDVKVFDAAGNTTDDINFDPTQKPKTNTIIIKLTDNFKRPLHLFDKYGRPLTDATGKLLVNIHGRPLLRFDNFGRPNTDYRGGPLYTDEGCRWSYKMGGSLASGQSSEERVSAGKMATGLENKLRPGSSSSTVDMTEKIDDLNENQFVNCDPSGKQKDKIQLKSRDSDIWAKVENILQHFPKRKEYETGSSETGMSVTKNIEEQKPIADILKPIIHHNNILHKDTHAEVRNTVLEPYNRDHSPLNNHIHNTYFSFENNYENLESGLQFDNYKKNNIYTIKNNLQSNAFTVDNNKNNGHLTADQINLLKNDVYLVDTPIRSTNYRLYKDILNKDNCTNCLHKPFVYQYPPAYLNNQSKNEQLQKEISSSNNGLMSISSCNPENCINKKVSNVTLKNNDYLNNLCNDILKHQFEYKDKGRRPLDPFFNYKTEKWTDTSFTLFTGSEDSKYSSDIPASTAKPQVFFCSKRAKLKKVEGYKNYCHPYKKRDEIKNIKKIKPFAQFEDLKQSHRDSKKYKVDNNKNTSSNGLVDENVSFESGTSVSINVLNQDNIHYEINVSEIKTNKNKNSQGKKKYIYNQLLSNNSKNNKKVQNCEFPKIVQDLPRQKTKKPDSSKNTENDCCSSISPTIKHDSPFRFPSDTNIESVIALNDQISVVKHVKRKPNDVKGSHNPKKDHNSQNKRVQNQNYNNCNTKHNTLPDKIFVEEYNTKVDEPCHKVMCDTKLNHFYKRGANPIRRPAPTTKQCNIVTFLGNPVKYVLNKIDNKFSSRQNNVNRLRAATRPINDSGRENEIPSNFTMDQSCKNKNTTSIETNDAHQATEKTNQPKDNPYKKHELLAFQSKSCIELTSQNDYFTMNYSGNENDSQNSYPTQLTCNNIIPSRSILRKCSSATYSSLRRSTRYQFSDTKPRVDQPLLKQNMTRKKHTSPHIKNEPCSKEIGRSTHSKNKKSCVETKKPNKDTIKRLVNKGKHCK